MVSLKWSTCRPHTASQALLKGKIDNTVLYILKAAFHTPNIQAINAEKKGVSRQDDRHLYHTLLKVWQDWRRGSCGANQHMLSRAD